MQLDEALHGMKSFVMLCKTEVMLDSCARRAQVYLSAFIPERIIKIDKLLQRLLTAPYLGTLFSEARIACSALS